VVSTPEVSGDLLFIGSCAGVFTRSISKRVKFAGATTLVKFGFHGNPIIIGGLVSIGTRHKRPASGVGYVYAFEVANGRQRWKTAANRGVASDLVLAGSSVCGVTLSDKLVAIDYNSGHLNWTFAPRPDKADRLPSSPAVSETAIFFGAGCGLISLKISTGEVI